MKLSSLTVAFVLAATDVVVGLAPPMLPPVQEVIVVSNKLPSITMASSSSSLLNIDQTILKGLEQETKAAEIEAKLEERKAKVEKSREAYFEYEAKMAAELEARTEAAERKALEEALKDKQEAEALLAKEKQAEPLRSIQIWLAPMYQ